MMLKLTDDGIFSLAFNGMFSKHVEKKMIHRTLREIQRNKVTHAHTFFQISHSLLFLYAQYLFACHNIACVFYLFLQ